MQLPWSLVAFEDSLDCQVQPFVLVCFRNTSHCLHLQLSMWIVR